MKFWPFLSLLLATSVATAQTPVLEKLRAQVEAHPQADTGRVNRLNTLAFEQRSKAPRESRATFEEALRLAQQLGYRFGEAKALLGLGFYYRKRNEYGPAQLYTQQARQKFAALNDQRNHLACSYNLAYICSGQGNYTQALDFAQQALTLAETLNDQHWLVLMNAQMGIISTEVGEYTKARRHLERCLALARQTNNQPGISQGLRGLADLYRTQGNWDAARRYYEQDATLTKRLGDEPGFLVDEMNVADMAERQGRLTEAFAYSYRVLHKLRQLDVVGYLPWTQLVLARAHLHSNRPDSAAFYGKASLRASLRSGVKENIRDVSEVLTQASVQLGRFPDAYRYQRLFGIYQDSLSSRELIRRLAAVQYSYELARRQARISQLTRNEQLIRQKNRQQQWLLVVTLVGLGLVGWLSAVLWRSNRQKQRAYALLEQQQAELLATQQQLVAAEKWAFVGELSAGIAHELQNPLHFMRNFAEVSVALLDQDSTRPVPATADGLQREILAGLKQNLQEISQHGQRASSIITDMLTHARTGTSPQEPVALNALVEEQLRLAYRSAQATHPTLQVHLHTSLDATMQEVRLVRTEIGRVLLNLFTNAFHALATRQAALEDAYLPTLEVSTHQVDGHIHIRVRDNGTGMPEVVKEQIFQPFFTTKPQGEGTGLGLSMAYDIVTKGHEGSLRVESEEGRFTEFTVTLPR
ncbi:tetratricopeptide repeat protein [Hymenobacter psychrotolerans]|uniref:histidine kinase n=1 Tax=Hymenobacter psychrotolerans DSM 18569 TaxID=1121959 RepID=A0A1M6V5P0_9BACT|nr:tetratricopeptide repeat protein [Hymenobacter psychrotolerans]SHK76691.1 Tetratricopeptide repeat-containing protein [Hymenobacter psychrotolerans DSM 18569]